MKIKYNITIKFGVKESNLALAIVFKKATTGKSDKF